MPTLFWFIFVVVCGACVGSFLNVVIYRLPNRLSLVTPPSTCPGCQKSISWYDNIPILSWLILRGRCRNCSMSISVQYPIIEAITAVTFGLIFASYYMWDFRTDVASIIQPLRLPWTWPLLVTHLVLAAALIAATVIDARLYIIPISLPLTAIIVAFVLLPLGAYLYPGMIEVIKTFALQRTVQAGHLHDMVHAGFGGMAGVVLANVLLRFRLVPLSFDEAVIPEAELAALEGKSGPEGWYQWPHPRLEVMKELLFVSFPLAGALAAAAFMPVVSRNMPPWVIMLGLVAFGYLVGAAIVWIVRILGTLAFGKEAMGLGDVHLLAAVGACTGWRDPLLVFFIAPFLGLAWAVGSAGMSRLLRREVRMIPYGPHLAVTALGVMIFHRPLLDLFCRWLLIC